MPGKYHPKKTGKPGSGRKRSVSRKREARKPGIETPQGHTVRSKYEKTCTAFFEKNGIEYKYEPLILLGGKQYRPDFYLPQYDLFIEICGYNHMPHYRDRVKKKEEAYARGGLKAAFIYYNGTGSLEKLLIESLRPYRDGDE